MKPAEYSSAPRDFRSAPPARGAGGAWHVTRYQDVQLALRDPRLSAQRGAAWHATAFHPFSAAIRRRLHPEGAVAELRGHWLALSDPPEHPRLRDIIKPLWTMQVQHTRARLEALIQTYVARVREGGTVDLIQQFASPLPMQITAMLMGLPANVPDYVTRGLVKTDVMAGFARNPSASELAKANRVIGYAAQVIADKRAEPGDDLISALIATQRNGAALSDAELTTLVLLLLITGYRTPFYFFGGAVELLLQQPDPFAVFRGAKHQTALAIEELLRLTSSADSTERIVTTEMELGGAHLRRGERLSLNLQAANHDPTQFAAPEQPDWTRVPNPHLAFGSGAHICLGAGLARLEAELVFKTLAGTNAVHAIGSVTYAERTLVTPL